MQFKSPQLARECNGRRIATDHPAAGWKYRNALILGHVKAIKRVNVEVTPMNPEKKGTTVVRHPDKLMRASDIAKEDLEEAKRQGGHSACTGRPCRLGGGAAGC